MHNKFLRWMQGISINNVFFKLIIFLRAVTVFIRPSPLPKKSYATGRDRFIPWYLTLRWWWLCSRVGDPMDGLCRRLPRIIPWIYGRPVRCVKTVVREVPRHRIVKTVSWLLLLMSWHGVSWCVCVVSSQWGKLQLIDQLMQSFETDHAPSTFLVTPRSLYKQRFSVASVFPVTSSLSHF